jgi:hypothetical protein
MIRRIAFVCLLAVTAAVVGCNESLDSGAVCPGLCPQQQANLRDTVISPVLLFDSTFVGYPVRGTESAMLLANRGDTLQVVGIVRFDTLTTIYVPPSDSAHHIVQLDSAHLRIIIDTTNAIVPDSVRFDLYDVDDLIASDTSSAAVLAKFNPSRLIGGSSFVGAAVHDTIYLALDTVAVLAKITNGARLRVGIRVSGSGSVSFQAKTSESSSAAAVLLRPTLDTLVPALVVTPLSSTPALDSEPRVALTDFQLVAKYNMPTTINTMSVGGVPGRRAYLRFDIPKSLSDSSTIIRATLRLNQVSLGFGGVRDSILVYAVLGLASPDVTDLRRATTIIGAPGLLVSDSIFAKPTASGLQSIELFNVVRTWAQQSTLTSPPPRALILRAASEGLTPAEIRFSSSTAAVALRPSMRITYVPKTTFGVP